MNSNLPACKTLVLRFVQFLLPLWLGFVLAISFMEAWLKFLAPGVTRSIGLSVGKLVFFALNKVEISLLSLTVVGLYLIRENISYKTKTFCGVLAVILLIQTTYLLPSLDKQAVQIIRGNNVSGSSIHFFYILLEVLKVLVLILTSSRLYKDGNKNLNPL